MSDSSVGVPTVLAQEPSAGSRGVPGRLRAVLADSRGQALLAALLYLGYAIFLTWPLVLHLHSQVFGSSGNDEFSLLANIRDYTQLGRTPFTPSVIHTLSAPEGVRIDWALNLATWSSWLILWVLAAPFREVFALGIFVLLGYTLNGLSMFLLARRLTGSAAAGLVAGFALAFIPFTIVNGTIHEQFMHVWVFVLMAWRLLELSERPSARNGVWAGLASVVALSWTTYFILFGAVLFAAFVVFDLVSALTRHRDRLGRLTVGYGIAGGLVLLMGIADGIAARSSSSNALGTVNTINQLYTYTARPLEYLLPDAHNLIFGTLTSKYLFSHAHGSGYGEFNLYLGLVSLALAAYGVVALVRRRLAPDLRRPLLLFGFLALFAAWFSGPPTWHVGPLSIPFPSDAVFHVVNGFRVYSRIVGVVAVGVTACAAIGLAHLLRGRSLSVRTAIVVVLIPVIALDLWARPDPATSALPHPAIYSILRHEPPGIVAAYPLAAADIPSYEPLLDQPQMGHPLLNGYDGRSDEEARAMELTQLSDPHTAPRLALLGVRYVVDNLAPPPEYTAAPGTPGAGFKLIAQEGGYALYRVVAPPVSSWVSVGAGFSPPEGPSGTVHWLTTPSSSLEIRAVCDPCSGQLVFATSSFLRPRRVQIRSAAGRLLSSVQVGTSATQIAVPVHFNRVDRLTLSISPGPESALASTGGRDPRDLGVVIVDPGFLAAK